ncbi:ABC transporter substrate-binding protein [Alteromonadaceae bacterium BrNp21-10]|nr:ABC transporter substrate-binding protein [Alteromonadaceae bacterium BrNp21-10]
MFGKRVSLFILLLSLVAPSVWAQSADNNPYVMVEDAATKTFARIKKQRDEIQKNPEILREIMKDELLPHVDYKFSALKVLGKHFKSVPKEKIPEFIQVFREYLITTYAIAMAQYDNQTLEFEPHHDLEDDKEVTVRALIKEAGRPDIKIAFKVRKSRQTNEWKAYDMIAEGISLLSSKQSELEGVIRQNGIDVVIKMLQEKIEKPIVLESK